MRQMCPAAAVNGTGSCRHCWRLDCCSAQLHILCFVLLTAAVLHCCILLHVMGFDSMYCMLWVGKSCLVCSSSDLCPGHSYHLHLSWHSADVQSMQALCKGSRLASSQQQQGQPSRNELLVQGWEITSIYPYKASREHNPKFTFIDQQSASTTAIPFLSDFCYKQVCLTEMKHIFLPHVKRTLLKCPGHSLIVRKKAHSFKDAEKYSGYFM